METILTEAFSDPGAPATPWDLTDRQLGAAELYWLSTVRADGRPHVTPLVGVWLDQTFWFTTGAEEQKSRNLAHGTAVAVTTGANRWAEGIDVVLEGRASLRRDHTELEDVAAAYRSKYAGSWPFERTGEQLTAGGGHRADLWGVEVTKVLAFAKSPHTQTSYRF
ncbi:hypothetical protein GCM10011519_15250 [Marmoricola endophyticus]|uniref:Pyridoxamine 5'-phosphate oxidase N-terminal domain-containing protein n=1 Tax=Marmoricola endophyticus TaxID=2040280 RepID=A0A917BGH6_9ACTN|nr:pyridoxamine 5'-phosphate oxidase family protein [Marmoricola endophyticus]GGF42354.1 hypothetical protein GCM10011519_15250 [Marmoricola endophyticus]